MAGISEVIQTMGAMVLFSLILMTSNKMILLNSQKEVESDAEKRAIAIAQTYIEEARVLPFDDNTVSGIPAKIPDDFTTCGSGGVTNKANFDDFDDYHNWSEDVDWIEGSGDNAFHVDIKVLYVTTPDFDMASGSTSSKSVYKKMAVTVTSDYLTNNNGDNIEITLPYLRRYYKLK